MATPGERRYANYFEIGYTASEVFFDIGQFDPQTEAVIRHTQIVTTPASARTFHQMLGDALRQYEERVAVIPAPEDEQ